MKRPVILLILDGWGISGDSPGNAIQKANTPNFDRIWQSYPHTHLIASGEAVGLPRSEVGNTETGHLNMGAGHVVYQDLPRINMAIADGTFYINNAFIQAMQHARDHKSTLHIMGLIGAGGVHANNEHLFALLTFCQDNQFHDVALHLFTDGRDSPPTIALQYIMQVEEQLKQIGFGTISSITGRYYGMDRDERWERTSLAYHALVNGTGNVYVSAADVIKDSYKHSVTDEFIKPGLIKQPDGSLKLIKNNDAVIMYNYRIDRTRQITKAFVLDHFEEQISQENIFEPLPVRFVKRQLNNFAHRRDTFTRGPKLKNLFFVTMTEYEKGLPVSVAFSPMVIKNPLGRILADNGLRQLRLAESEKERFVTFYFNGMREMPHIGEDRNIIKSLEIATYDLAPQMRTRELFQALIETIRSDVYDAYIVNIAAADMVGHTGVLSAAIRAIEVIDECLGFLEQEVLSRKDACFMLTADHGNCEEMIDPKTGGVNTEHSNNPVPFIAVAKQFEGVEKQVSPGILADLAPTLLSYLGVKVPYEMTGKNLLEGIGESLSDTLTP